MADEVFRRILHVDMDAFYVSVELLRHPELVGKPVVVGGTGSRSVVAAASYEARRHGVYSAMSSAHAQRLCPDAIFLPGDLRLYSEVSTHLHEIFRSVSPLVEGIALDEAFIDVTGAMRVFGDAKSIGEQLRVKVLEETGLVCCVGVGPNKFLAKLASRSAKPKIVDGNVVPGPGVFEIKESEARAFLNPLPVRAMWGVGEATAAKLDRIAIHTIEDITKLDVSILIGALGNAAGRQLYDLAHGIDHRVVEADRDVKSIGHEETFAEDVHVADQLRTHLVRLADAVAARVRKEGVAARTVSLRIRYGDLTSLVRSITPRAAVTTSQGIMAALDLLLPECEIARGVRLAGVTLSNFSAPEVQLSLDFGDDEPTDAEWIDASNAIDEIRQRFGSKSIGPLSAMGHGRDLGESPWGPSH